MVGLNMRVELIVTSESKVDNINSKVDKQEVEIRVIKGGK